MWERVTLKTNAKYALKANYWKAVIAALVMLIITGGSAAANGNRGGKEMLSGSFSLESALALLPIVLTTMAFAGLISLVMWIFLWNPIEVGCQKFFIQCKYGKPDLGTLGFAFKNNYGNVTTIMFFRSLFTILWFLLLIVPGIVKSYEYMMIPYLLADNPYMSREEAFAKSKEMMNGNKMDAFLLDLSFIGWHILEALTAGILGVFYVGPYVYLTKAELYHALKGDGAMTSNKTIGF